MLQRNESLCQQVMSAVLVAWKEVQWLAKDLQMLAWDMTCSQRGFEEGVRTFE